MARRAGSVTDN